MERIADCKRTTKETDIALILNLDGSGKADIDSEFLVYAKKAWK